MWTLSGVCRSRDLWYMSMSRDVHHGVCCGHVNHVTCVQDDAILTCPWQNVHTFPAVLCLVTSVVAQEEIGGSFSRPVHFPSSQLKASMFAHRRSARSAKSYGFPSLTADLLHGCELSKHESIDDFYRRVKCIQTELHHNFNKKCRRYVCRPRNIAYRRRGV